MPLFRPLIFREDGDIPIGFTYLGTEIFSSLVFKEVKIEDPDVDPSEFETLAEIDLITVILSVSERKNVVSTQVQGRRGEVKEYISGGDFTIRVRGSIVGEQRGVAPYDQAALLSAHLTLGQSLEVAGNFLDVFDITTVVIMDYDISEVLGSRNQFDFTINMVSDTPIELEVSRENTTE